MISNILIHQEKKDISILSQQKIKGCIGYNLHLFNNNHFGRLILYKNGIIEMNQTNHTHTHLCIFEINTGKKSSFTFEGILTPCEFLSEEVLLCKKSTDKTREIVEVFVGK